MTLLSLSLPSPLLPSLLLSPSLFSFSSLFPSRFSPVYLLQFYAPWCTFCKQMDPVWTEIGSELRSLGSPVQVGRVDATRNTGTKLEPKQN
uniref:protein disulfide-isomerase n=1 Tax=Periophthalmus magnuspinnatus TaxID=409849 RepID=A0A3B4BGZ6_9GOBI